MIRSIPALRDLRQDQLGTAIVEFALIAPLFFLILLAFVDLAYRGYAIARVDGTLEQAVRMATVGDKTETQIDDFVRNRLTQFNPNATVNITKSNYYQFSNVAKSEKLITDSAPVGVWNTGDCYEDLNNNGKWDTVAGRDGMGGSDDIIFYKVDYTFKRVVPLAGLLGWSNNQTVSSNTVMRNQPYAVQSIPIQKCTSS